MVEEIRLCEVGQTMDRSYSPMRFAIFIYLQSPVHTMKHKRSIIDSRGGNGGNPCYLRSGGVSVYGLHPMHPV